MIPTKQCWMPDVLLALRVVQTEGVSLGQEVRSAMSCSQAQAYRIFKAVRDLRLLEPAGEPETWRVGPRSKAWMEIWGVRL